MATGTDDEFAQQPEPTFADVMNGFSLDSSRARRRRWGRRRDEGGRPIGEPGMRPGPGATEVPRHEWTDAEATSGQLPPGGQVQPGNRYAPGGRFQPGDQFQPGGQFQPGDSFQPGGQFQPGDQYSFGEQPSEPEPEDEVSEFGAAASAVRPYSWTRGRTKSGLDLAIETLVSTSHRGRDQLAFVQVEHRAVAALCEEARSVAEVAALLKLPLGVARVLLGDMAGLGLVVVHQTASSNGNTPDLALMERVLSGLRRL